MARPSAAAGGRWRWDRAKIDAGRPLETALGQPGGVSPDTVQAAIAAVHARASSSQATNWPQIAALDAIPSRLQPLPMVELNWAVAVAMVAGPAAALHLLDSLAARGQVIEYHLLHAARGRFLEMLGRIAAAREAYAAALCTSTLE